MDNNSKKFKDLQAKWYKKLEKSGFDDIEKLDHIKFQTESSYYWRNYGHEKFAEKQRYYQLAGQFLHQYVFDSPRDKEIWRLHSEGLAIKTEIPKKIKDIKRSQIHETIKRLRKIMLSIYLGPNYDE